MNAQGSASTPEQTWVCENGHEQAGCSVHCCHCGAPRYPPPRSLTLTLAALHKTENEVRIKGYWTCKNGHRVVGANHCPCGSVRAEVPL